jgi:predicted acyltransferase
MAGLASLCAAFCYWIVDVKGWTRMLRPLEIFGMNAIAAYIVSRLIANVDKVHIFGRNLFEVYLSVAKPANASLLYGMTHVLAVYVVAWFMYRRRWFLRF